MRKGQTHRRWFVRAAIAGSAVLALGISACAERIANSQSEPARDSSSSGPVQLVIDAALERGELTDAQEAKVIAISERVAEAKRNKRERKKQLRGAAGAIVRDGGTDQAAIDRAVDQAMVVVAERVRVGADALKELHALLDVDQRALVAEEVRERWAEKKERRRNKERGRHFAKRASDLMLSAVQVEAFQKARRDFMSGKKELRPSDEQIEDLIDAFEGPDFAAQLDALCKEKQSLARERLTESASRVEDVLSVLSEDQRHLLADLIESDSKSEETDT